MRPQTPQAELTHPPWGAGEVVRLGTLRVPAVRPSPGVHSADTFQSRSCARCVRAPPVHPAQRQFSAGSLGIYSGGRCCSPTSRARLVCILSSPAPPRETLLAQPSLPSDADGGWMDDATHHPSLIPNASVPNRETGALERTELGFLAKCAQTVTVSH